MAILFSGGELRPRVHGGVHGVCGPPHGQPPQAAADAHAGHIRQGGAGAARVVAGVRGIPARGRAPVRVPRVPHVSERTHLRVPQHTEDCQPGASMGAGWGGAAATIG